MNTHIKAAATFAPKSPQTQVQTTLQRHSIKHSLSSDLEKYQQKQPSNFLSLRNNIKLPSFHIEKINISNCSNESHLISKRDMSRHQERKIPRKKVRQLNFINLNSASPITIQKNNQNLLRKKGIAKFFDTYTKKLSRGIGKLTAVRAKSPNEIGITMICYEPNSKKIATTNWRSKEEFANFLLTHFPAMAVALLGNLLSLKWAIARLLAMGIAYEGYKDKGYKIERRVTARKIKIHEWYGEYTYDFINSRFLEVKYQGRGPSKVKMISPMKYEERIVTGTGKVLAYKKHLLKFGISSAQFKRMPYKSFSLLNKEKPQFRRRSTGGGGVRG